MSFLRRDKSRPNLKAPYGFENGTQTAGQSEESQAMSPTSSQFPPGFNPEYTGSAGAAAPSDDYSPRLLVLYPPGDSPEVETNTKLKENYKGFHANKRPRGIANVPPLSHPIKPRFKKKPTLLLGKWIYLLRKEDEQPLMKRALTGGVGGQRHLVPLAPLHGLHSALTLVGHTHRSPLATLLLLLGLQKTKFRLPLMLALKPDKDKEVAHKGLVVFDLNLDEMQGIVDEKKRGLVGLGVLPVAAPLSLVTELLTAPELQLKTLPPPVKRLALEAAWTAPELWDVKATAATLPSATVSTEPDEPKSPVAPTPLDGSSHQFPLLFGRKRLLVVQEGPNNIIRVFREDNTFTTILCPLETTTNELLTIVQRKFFLEQTNNYQISIHTGNHVKVMELFEKPLRVQRGLLTLLGYTEKENLKILGREDLLFLAKFVVECISLRNLTHDEELTLSKDYVDVDILGLNLKNVPIIFHQHTYEIEKLNVSDNPAIHIPLDFIQSCNNLTTIDYSRNGASKFPVNFLQAPLLQRLELEMNFLDELPKNFGSLSHLTHLKLNLNQLLTLPALFAQLPLKVLNLLSNYFSEYPEVINLLPLVELDLSYNDLEHLPLLIGRLLKLSKLNLCTNKLSRELPHFFAELTLLKRLDIRYNQITNVDILGTLPNLEVTYASKNYINKFSDQMTLLRLIHFDRNPITNLQFVNTLQLLTILDLSKAKITILPPEFVSKIPNIEKFVLDKNHLVTLPAEIGSLQRLTVLLLTGNNLRNLPPLIGQLQGLQFLDCHSNNLQTLPEEIWLLSALLVLNLALNIMPSFPKPTLRTAPPLAASLLSLVLTDNRLLDDCFDLIVHFGALKYLNLSYNDLLEIPEGALARLPDLQELLLLGNQLTTLPGEDLETLSRLKLLHVNNNKLVTIPAELAKLKHLQHLDVGSNQLKYNIANWPYDWNWQWNTNLRLLNFSGNKRFEIKQTYVKNPDTGDYLDSLLCLPKLRVLGLVDVTITTLQVPDQSMETRIRLQLLEVALIGYGVLDFMGTRDHVLMGDLFVQKFRGNEKEILFCLLDGKGGPQHKGHRILYLVKQIFVETFTGELERLVGDETPADALRRAFLAMNKEINGVLAAKKSGTYTGTSILGELSLEEDLAAGCSLTVIYLCDKKLYAANVGDFEALLSRSNGDHVFLTSKHDPTSRKEFERIRALGGFVLGTGQLNGELGVLRGVGFFNYLPHTNAGPSITEWTLSLGDDTIVLGTSNLWEYVPYELAVDIIRQEKQDPMLAAQRLRDYAIAYGAVDKVLVTVVHLGDKRKPLKAFGNYLRNIRRDRGAPVAGDLLLRRLDDEIEPPVGLLALVFTDIKNLTWLWDTFAGAMRLAIKIHNTIMRRQLRIVGGYEVKTEGDAFMVSFPTPTLALLWCFNVQQALLTADWPLEILETDQCCEVTDGEGQILFRGLLVRMGIHWGSPVCEPDIITGRMDYFGPMVNRALRILAVADGGQIAVLEDFIDEMETLYKIHDSIQLGQTTIEATYREDPDVGEMIEKEIKQIETIGYKYFPLGEKKLKGLETPEKINLAYADNLQLRIDIFQKRMSDDGVALRAVGAIPVEAIYGLRTLLLRLENVCACADTGKLMLLLFQNLLPLIQRRMLEAFKETEMVELFNHLVLRIENCALTLFLRQQLALARGEDGFIDFGSQGMSVDNVLTELEELVTAFRQLSPQ